jgi:putative two-component system response regulator
MSKYTAEFKNPELLDAIRRLSLMAELRVGKTKNHLDRVQGYSRVIADGLGLATQEVEVIYHASQLHDVGLVGVPEDILNKKDELAAFEFEYIKRHPNIGGDLLNGSPSLIIQLGETIARTHHERWDGSGYPKGLKGEDIPLSGRICAIADVFDALTTERPYKKEIPIRDALELIQDAGGTLFDPQLVVVFGDYFDDIVAVRQENI